MIDHAPLPGKYAFSQRKLGPKDREEFLWPGERLRADFHALEFSGTGERVDVGQLYRRLREFVTVGACGHR